MAKKPYDEVNVVRILNKNRGIEVKSKMILVDENSVTVGNGTWGKIDYLCRHCGYSYTIQSRFNAKREISPNKKLKTKEVNTNAPKSKKINLVNKSIIKIPKY